MPTYRIEKDYKDVQILIRLNDDGSESFIPMDESNADYRGYLNKDKPQAEQSTPMIPGDE